LQCSMAEHSVAESAGSVTLIVTRTGGTDGVVSVAYATGDGSASAPDDYTSASGTFQWPQGDTSSKSFPISIVDDQRAESNETFVLHLSNPSGTVLGTTTSAAITIMDDDAAPTIGAIGDLTVSEGATTAPVAVVLGDADDAPASLTLSATSSNPTVLADAGVVLGGTGTTRTLTVAALTGGAGESTVTVTVSDGANSATRSFKVTVVAAPNQQQDAGAPEPQDSGPEMHADAGTFDSDAAMGPEDAAVDPPDSGSVSDSDAGPDGGSSDAANSDSGCGCDVPGRSGSAPKSLLAGVVGLAAIGWRRRRNPRQ
jgi:MYXO-CTERM domain-containing protein